MANQPGKMEKCFHAPSEAAQTAFNSIFGGLVGAKNKLLANRIQIVRGVVYEILFTSTPVVPNAKTRLLKGGIYVDVIKGKKPEFLGTHSISSDLWGESDKKGLFGGWSVYGSLNAQDEAVFEKATKDLVGVGYKALKVTRRMVYPDGIYRVYECQQTMVSTGSTTTCQMLVLEQPQCDENNVLLLDIH